MKAFAFVVFHKPRDGAGNPKDTIRVYRIMTNKPTQIGGEAEIGYRTPQQAAVDVAVQSGYLSKKHAGKTTARLFNDDVAEFYEL